MPVILGPKVSGILSPFHYRLCAVLGSCLLFGNLHTSFTVPPCLQPVLDASPLPRPLTAAPLFLAAQLLTWLHDPQRWSLFFLTAFQVATGAHEMTPVPFGPLPFIAKRVPPFPSLLPRPRPVCS